MCMWIFFFFFPFCLMFSVSDNNNNVSLSDILSFRSRQHDAGSLESFLVAKNGVYANAREIEQEAKGSRKGQKVITSHDADVTLRFLRENDNNVLPISEFEERKLSRKVVWIIVPLCALLDFVLYADKTTASYTSIFNMWEDTGLDQNKYNNSTTLFYAGYIIGQVNLVFVQKFPLGYVIAVLSFLLSLIIYLHTLAVNYQGVYALRFFLGFVESIAVPTLNITMGHFLTAQEKAWTAPLFYSTCLGNEIVVVRYIRLTPRVCFNCHLEALYDCYSVH